MADTVGSAEIQLNFTGEAELERQLQEVERVFDRTMFDIEKSRAEGKVILNIDDVAKKAREVKRELKALQAAEADPNIKLDDAEFQRQQKKLMAQIKLLEATEINIPVEIDPHLFRNSVRQMGMLQQAGHGLVQVFESWGSQLASTRIHMGFFSTSLRALPGLLVAVSTAVEAVVGALGAMIATISSGLVGALALASAAVTGFIGTLVGIGLAAAPAFDKLGNKVKGFVDRFQKLTAPIADRFVNLFERGIDAAGKLLGPFTNQINKSFSVLAHSTREWFRALETPQARNIMEDILANTRKAIPPLMDALGNLAVTFGQIFQAASHFLRPAAVAFRDWTEGLREGTSHSKALRGTIRTMLGDFDQLVDTLGAFGNVIIQVFRGGRGEGRSLLKTMEDLFDGWAKFLGTNRGQRELREWFKDTVHEAVLLAQGVGEIIEVFHDFAQIGRAIIRFFERHGGAIIDAFNQIQIVQAVQGMMRAMKNLEGIWHEVVGGIKAGASAVLRVFAGMLDGMADMIGKLSGIPIIGDKFEGAANGIRSVASSLRGAADAMSRTTKEQKQNERQTRQNADAYDRLERVARSRFGDIAGVSRRDMKKVERAMRQGANKGERAMGQAFDKAIDHVRKAMRNGRISTEKGTKLIESLMKKQLKLYGVDDPASVIQAAKKGARGPAALGGHNTQTFGNQEGGIIGARSGIKVPGSGTGDKVPAMLEPGEVVLNRKAVAKMGGAAKANAINALIPRFAKGGIVALGQQLQREGYEVGEHPAFGGVGSGHTSGSYHYRNMAIDVNDDSPPFASGGGEPGSLDRLYSRLKGAPGVVELLWRVADHFDHLHVAMGPGGGALSGFGMAQQISLPRFAQAVKKRGHAWYDTLADENMNGGALNALSVAAETKINDALGSQGAIGVSSAHGSLSQAEIASVWTQAGGPRSKARIASAIAMAESSGDPNAVSYAGARGLWQIMPFHVADNEVRRLFEPIFNAVQAIRISSGGSDWGAWDVAGRAGQPVTYTNFLREGGVVQPFRGYAEGTGDGKGKKIRPDEWISKALNAPFTMDASSAATSFTTAFAPPPRGMNLQGSMAWGLGLISAGVNEELALADPLARISMLTNPNSDYGVPQGMQDRMSVFRLGADRAADYASMANSLTTESPTPGARLALGVAGGKNEGAWLNEQLNFLMQLRNEYITASGWIDMQLPGVKAALAFADGLVRDYKKAVRVYESRVLKFETEVARLEDRLERVDAAVEDENKKHAQRIKKENERFNKIKDPKKADREAHKKRLKALNERHDKNLNYLKRQRKKTGQALRDANIWLGFYSTGSEWVAAASDAASGEIQPGVADAFSALQDGRTGIASDLAAIQGPGRTMRRMFRPPPIGEFGGEIFDVQSAIKEFVAASGPGEFDPSAQLAAQEELLAAANARANVAEAQMPVFRDFFSALPQFHGGGVVSGFQSGGEVVARLQPNEGVFTPEQMAAMGGGPVEVTVVVEDGAVDARRIKAEVQGVLTDTVRKQRLGIGAR